MNTITNHPFKMYGDIITLMTLPLVSIDFEYIGIANDRRLTVTN